MECRRSRRAIILAISMVLLLSAGQYVSAEIPHENFDLVSADIDMVVQMLGLGINATEKSLISCLDGRPANGSYNLSLMDTIIVPVKRLILEIQDISKMQDIATSYDSLNYLILPFTNLSLGGHQFITNQSIFLKDFSTMKEYVGRSISGSQSTEARNSMTEARATVFSMSKNLDTMDGAAIAIANLTVMDRKAFNTTYLQELIDRLRILLNEYISLLNNLFFIIQWPTPFILMVVDQDIYPLGEIVRITGYLYGPSKIPLTGIPVEIWKDGALFNAQTITNNFGTFDAYWVIPIDKIQLGHHNLTATAIVNSSYLSDNKEIIVVRIPTALKFWLNGNRYSPWELIVATAILVDYKERPVHGRFISYLIDDRNVDLISSADGKAELRMNASDFEWGGHRIIVHFYGTEIFAPSVNDTQHFLVNLNTFLSMTLSADRVKRGERVTITTTLYANNEYSASSKPLPDRDVTIMLDDIALVTVPIGKDGVFAYSLNTSAVPAGTYIVKAFFISHEPKYEDAISEAQVLVIYVPSSGENGNNGNWWDGVTENFFWFILLILIIIILAILMLSKDRFQSTKTTDEGGMPRIIGRGATARAMNQTTSDDLIAGDSKVSGGMLGIDFSNMQPRVAIVKRYGILLDTLQFLRKIPIQANMTAREIEELLRKRGYPADETAKLTTGFERAMYSAREITPTDWERFSALADSMQNYSGDAR